MSLPRFRITIHTVAIAGKRWLRSLPGLTSLKLKLTLGFLSLAAAILLATYTTLSRTARDAASTEARRQAADLTSLFVKTVAESVAANDRMQVHVIAEALLASGVHALSVRGRDGEWLYRSARDLDEKHGDPEPDLVPQGDGVLDTRRVSGELLLHFARQIRFGDAPVGVMHLWLNATRLETNIHEANAFIYPVFAFGFLLMLGISIAVLHTPFRAMKRLARSAERIGKGDLSVRVPVRGKDEVASFCEAFNSMVDGLCRARSDLQQKQLETIQAMISTVEAKDSYTRGHCLRVRDYAKAILADEKSLTDDQKRLFETAALLHDIGKIGVPDRVLLKRTQLTEAEVQSIRDHVTIGEKILLHLDSMREIAAWVRHHHERWDGLGYPDGLRGTAIPHASRVITVADAIDAMMTNRPYRKGLARAEVIARLEEGRGKQFDPEIADRAIEILETEKERMTTVTV